MLPTEYLLEVCDTSGAHRPVARFHSSSPFTAVHVGDRFDDIGWERLDGAGILGSPTKPVRYTVHSIKHLITSTPDGLVVRYCLNLEPYNGPASPVWSDTGHAV